MDLPPGGRSAGTREPITIVHAGAGRFDAIAGILGGGGPRGCWCQAWRGAERDPDGTLPDRPTLLARQVAADRLPAPGFLAYAGENAVGWAGVSIRTEAPRLLRSRTLSAVDDLPVWAIGCLRVTAGHRRQGITRELVAGVVAAARAAGAPGVEAWPIDPGGRRVDGALAFTGILSTFLTTGFHVVTETRARSAGLSRILVRHDLGPGPEDGAPGGR